MRLFALALLMPCYLYGANRAAQAEQSSCKVCSELRQACIEKLCRSDVQV